MKFLLKAVFRVRSEFALFFVTLLALIGFTLTNHIEMITLGVLTDAGGDFFQLFSSSDSNIQGKTDNVVTYEGALQRWKEIDREGKGVITEEDVRYYLVTQERTNFLKRTIYRIKSSFCLEKSLRGFTLLLLLVASLKACFLFFSRYTTRIFAVHISRNLREQYFDHLQLLPMRFYQKHTIGTLSSRVSADSHQISLSINSFIANYIHAPFTILTTLIFCFLISWQLSLMIFFGLPLIIFPIIFLTKKVKAITRQLQRNQERFTSVLIDFLTGIQTVKVFGMEDFSMRKYCDQNNQMARLEKKTAKYDLLTRPILHTITTFCLATVIIFGIHILEMRISELVVFVALLYQFYEPVKKFAEENANIQKGVVAAERMQEVLKIKPQARSSLRFKQLKSFQRLIEFDKVSFRYDEPWVLQDVSFSIRHGESVALVGATGAGKSTIVQLLPRLYELDSGEIRIDGHSIVKYSKKSLRENMAFVSQKPFLFYDTIAANIAYGHSFSREEIIAAAKKAHADEFICQLPRGYETVVSETGKNLSGGQQQRLTIARALVKKAPILILDEATSALDSISEQQIKLTIEELHGEVTQIIIAHRLSTIEKVDRIIFLEKGRKVAEGTCDFLLNHCTNFRTMWETHFCREYEEGVIS